MCLAVYEKLMKDNAVRAAWKAKHPGAGEIGLQAAFVKRFLSVYVEQARAVLAGMLTQSTYSDVDKDRIHDILVKDKSLIRGRMSGHLN
jgi:hypothetical protein